MCKRLTGNEKDLLAYYRFDHVSGTTLADLSGNGNIASLNNMDNSDWVTSTAPLGDISTYDYDGSIPEDFTVSLSSSNGDQFTVTGVEGCYTGIHLYLINESPGNSTPPSGWTLLHTNHYWGVFPVNIDGNSYSIYDVIYNYNGIPNFTNENDLKLARRDNAIFGWSETAGIQPDTDASILRKSQQYKSEFILGESDTPTIYPISGQSTASSPISFTVSDSDGGNLIISATSSNLTILTDSNINISNSGSNTYTLSTSAGIPENLALTLSPTANQHGCITLTMTVTDSTGLTSTTKFTVIVSPPGAGNALEFDGTDDYISANVLLTGIDNFSMEAWVKWAGGQDNTQFIAYNGTRSSNGFGFFISGSNHSNYIGYLCGGVSTLWTTKKIVIDKWEHIAVVKNNGTWFFYLNGESLAVSSAGTKTRSGILSLGSNNTGGENFCGQIDELRIWNIGRT
jgi:hypothetical protein